MTADCQSPLERMVAHTRELYTLPEVALEVVRLTEAEQVDARQLKECLERDPALVARVLKVVNSSLFGLSGKVENLHQAIALLGSQPLKLLVLGFSLPDRLLNDVTQDQLTRFWRRSLARAVTARLLAESHLGLPGDEPFLVALLQDVGQLALLGRLGTTYATVLSEALACHSDLTAIERETLGFDHRELAAALMRNWHMPERFASVVQGMPTHWAAPHPETNMVLARAVHLAGGIAELVDGRRLELLPDVLSLAEQYAGLTADSLRELLAEVEPLLARMVAIFRIDVAHPFDYVATLTAAHQQMAELTVAAVEASPTDDQLCEALLASTRELHAGVRRYMDPSPADTRGDAAHAPAPPRTLTDRNVGFDRVEARLELLTTRCRTQRCELTLAIVEAASVDVGPTIGERLRSGSEQLQAMRIALGRACDVHDLAGVEVLTAGSATLAVLLPGVDRQQTVRAMNRLARDLCDGDHADAPFVVRCGVASVAMIPKGFASGRLIEAALGCLSAARATAASTVKSIEVY